MNGIFIRDGHRLESVISVRLVAIWLALDSIDSQVTCDTSDCSDEQFKDWERMAEFFSGRSRACRSSIVSPYLYDTIELPGTWWKQETDKFLKALQNSIEQGHITPVEIVRSFPDYKLDLDRTLLRGEEIESFLTLFDLQAGEQFYNPVGILNDWLTEVVDDSYSRLRSPLDLQEAQSRAASMNESAVVDLIVENRQLKEKLSKNKAQDAAENPRKSALLVIARALEVYISNQSNNNQTRFVSDLLEGENCRLLSERTVNGLLAQAKKDLANARKA